jgi:hypothetical protein
MSGGKMKGFTYTGARYSQSTFGGCGGCGDVSAFTVEKYTLALSNNRLIAIVRDEEDILSKVNNIDNIEIVEGCRLTNEIFPGDVVVYTSVGGLQDKNGNVWLFAIK